MTAFSSDPNKRRKGEFALELAAAFSERHSQGASVQVPDHIRELFQFLYAGPVPIQEVRTVEPEAGEVASTSD